MLEFLPARRKEEIKKLAKRAGIQTDEELHAFVGSENGKQIGFCLYTMDGSTVTLQHVEYEKALPHVSEGLIRSALNSAALLRAMYNVRIDSKLGDEIHLPHGFSKHGNEYNGVIPDILAGSCMNSCN